MLVDYYKESIDAKEIDVHESHYDYSELAKMITAGCDNDYEKIRAIYQWICENIEYDTSYSIHSADSCYDARKGVCQAYCELFYQMAKAVDVSVEMVSGKSKDTDGVVGKNGHAWIFAYTRENYGILMDPTWGAGSVDDGRFIRSDNCWEWFNVPPECMIFRHFPDDESYQLLSDPLSMEEFVSMKPVSNLWVQYGLDAKMLLKRARQSDLELPNVYGGAVGVVEIVDMPMCHSLRVGETYSFRIKMKSNMDFTIINGSVFTEKGEWKDEGHGVYSINFMVRDANGLKLGVKDSSGDVWDILMGYQIDYPSASDWEKVERSYPLCVPVAKQVKNLNAKDWEQAGVDGHQLLQLIRKYDVHELPIFYKDGEKELKIISVPMERTLRVGCIYTFRFTPKTGLDWAIINGSQWYQDWNITNGDYSMTITPIERGELKLSVQQEQDGPYRSCLGYIVEY